MNSDAINNLSKFLEHYFPENKVNINKFYEDLWSFFSETKKNFINRRNRELRNEGLKSKEINKIIIAEVNNHLFRGELFSERQIKRIIYKE